MSSPTYSSTSNNSNNNGNSNSNSHCHASFILNKSVKPSYIHPPVSAPGTRSSKTTLPTTTTKSEQNEDKVQNISSNPCSLITIRAAATTITTTTTDREDHEHCIKCHPLAYITQRCVFDCLPSLKTSESNGNKLLNHVPTTLLSIIVYVAAFMPHLLPSQQRVARLIVIHLFRKSNFGLEARAQVARTTAATSLISDAQILNEVLSTLHGQDHCSSNNNHQSNHKSTTRSCHAPSCISLPQYVTEDENEVELSNYLLENSSASVIEP